MRGGRQKVSNFQGRNTRAAFCSPLKTYAGGYTTTDATSYERGKTKITASEQSMKNKDEKRKNSKKGSTKKEDERRFSIFYRLVEAKGAPIIP